MSLLPAFSSFEKWLLQRILQRLGGAPIRLVLGDAEAAPPDGPIIGALRIADRRTLAALFLDPEIGFGEAYADGRVCAEGDLVEMLEVVYRSMARIRDGWYGRLVSG